MNDRDLHETLDDGLDLSSETGALEFCERHRARMAEWWRAEGRFDVNGFSFAGYVFATHDIEPPPEGGPRSPSAWNTGAKLVRVAASPVRLPAIMAALLPPGQETAAFAHVVREYARITRAVGVMLLTESWLAEADLTPEQQAQGVDAAAVRATLPPSLEDAPGRAEALMMRLEHAALGERMWKALITREPDALGPWQPLPFAAGAGRLVNLIDWQRPQAPATP